MWMYFQLLCKIVTVHIQALYTCTVCSCACQADRNILGVVPRHVPGVVRIMFRGLCQKFVVVGGGGWVVGGVYTYYRVQLRAS